MSTQLPIWVMIVGSVCTFLLLVLAAGGVMAPELDERDIQESSDGKSVSYKALCPCCAKEWIRFRPIDSKGAMNRFAYCPPCSLKIKR